MLEALVDRILILIIILTLAVGTSVRQRQYSVPELLNQNAGFKLSMASISNEENVTETSSWPITQLNDIMQVVTTEDATPRGSTAVPVSTELFMTTEQVPTVIMEPSTERSAPFTEMTDDYISIEVVETSTALDPSTEGSAIYTETTADSITTEVVETSTALDPSTEASATYMETTAESTSAEVVETFTPVGCLFETTAASMSSTVDEGTWTAESGASTEMTSYWATSTIEETALTTSITAEVDTAVNTITAHTATINAVSGSTADTTTSTTKPTMAIASETVASEVQTLSPATETTSSATTTAAATAPVQWTTITTTEATVSVSTFSTANPTSTETTTEELPKTTVPTAATTTVQATTLTSTEALALVSTFSSTNPTFTVTATEELLTMTIPTAAITTVQATTLTSTEAIALVSGFNSTEPTSTVRTTEESPMTAIPYETPSSTTSMTSRGSTMATTATISTAMPTTTTPTVASTNMQTLTSNRLTTLQSTTPEMRIAPSIVDKALEQLEQENVTVQTVGKIAEQLANVTTNAEVLSLSSAIKATNIVANISALILNNNFTKELYPVPKLIGQIAAGLMNLNSTDLASVESQSKVSVQQSLETSLSALALAAMQNGSTINENFLKLQDDNLAFQVVINTSISGIRISSASSLSQALLEMVPYESASISSASSSSMQSRNETLVQLSPLVAQSPKTFLVYNSAKLFQAKDGLQPDNNGRVVSAQLPGTTIKAQELIKIVFPPMLSNLERKCGYWSYSAKAWSTEGCNAVIGNDSSVTCTCEHLTNFAVLLAVNNVPSSLALDILSTIGLSLSCLSLAAVVITFLAIKKMRRTVSQKVLFNLALSLLILDLLFLFGIDKTSSRNGCIAIAALLHYFLLTSFMWMLMESILQYLRFVKVLGTYIPRFLPKTVVPAWGVPAVIVAIVCGVDVGLYDGGEKFYCMAQKQVVYYAILLPIGIILVINWAIFIVVLKSFCCHRRLAYQSKRPESSLAKLHAQAGVAVCTLLGLTWVFGFLTAIPDATTGVAFQWLFCICNTLQGFVIFLFHCLRENALQKELRRLCCRTGPLAATSQSEDSSSTSKTASSVVSRSQNVSMTTMSSASLGGSGILSFHKGSYNFSEAEHRTRRNFEIS